MTRRRGLLLGTAAGLGLQALGRDAAAQAGAAGGERVLRYAIAATETGFDPQKINDVYSIAVTAHIFESLYEFDPLARPYKIVPSLAEGLPEVADGDRSFTIRIKPGVFFQDDPAFGGRRRELVAEDFIYTWKRLYDPATQAASQSAFEELGVIGLRELRERALQTGQPFDYAQPVEGLAAPDRHTLRIRLREPRPRFVFSLTSPGTWGVMAREVVAHYGDRIIEHPVGTGPFRLAAWRRSSLITLVRNPTYRARTYDAQPEPDDAEGQALLARFKGRRLPMLDRVEVSVIEEAQPRWLAFLNAEQDLLDRVPNDFIAQAVPGGRLAPALQRRGVQAYRIPASDVTLTVFNMAHPAIGGLDEAQVALRRAIGLALDIPREIALARRGQAVAAQSLNTPGTFGHEDGRRTEAGLYDPARAKALLELTGWRDRDGDGWRERPDGTPLVLELLSQSDQASRQIDELFKKGLDAIGVRVVLKVGQWSENLKATRAGRFQMWNVGSTSTSPDGQSALEAGYSRAIGKGNMARFSLPAFDALYERMQVLPDGPERLELFRQANKLLLAYAPYRVHVHRLITDLAHPWVVGYRRPRFSSTWWTYVDVEPRGATPSR